MITSFSYLVYECLKIAISNREIVISVNLIFFVIPHPVISTWIHMEIFKCYYNGRVHRLDMLFVVWPLLSGLISLMISCTSLHSNIYIYIFAVFQLLVIWSYSHLRICQNKTTLKSNPNKNTSLQTTNGAEISMVLNVSFLQFVYVWRSFQAPHLCIQIGKVTKIWELIWLMYACTWYSKCIFYKSIYFLLQT